jgi:hypothetical protein
MKDNDRDCQYVSGPTAAMEVEVEVQDNCVLSPSGPIQKAGWPTGLTLPNCTGTLDELNYRTGTHTVVNPDVGKQNIRLSVAYNDKTDNVFTNCGAPKNDCDDDGHNHKYSFKFKQRHTGSYTWYTHPEYKQTDYCPDGDGGSYPCGWHWVGSPQSHTTNYIYWGSPAPTITTTMTGDSSYGGSTGTGECPPEISPNYDGTGTYDENEHRWRKVTDSSVISSNAQFNIPYNYELAPVIQPVELEANMIIGGSDWNYQTWIDTNAIPNAEFPGNTFATLTRPDTTWKITEYYVSENEPSHAPYDWSGAPITSAPSVIGYTNSGNTSLDPCAVYLTSSQRSLSIQNVANTCRVVDQSTGSLNEDQGLHALGSSLGSSDPAERAYTSHTAHVADAPAGTKFCIGLSVMDYRSGTVNETYGDATKGWWLHLKPKCASIAKIPTMQIWGGGLYSEGKVTGLYAEKLNATEPLYYQVNNADGKGWLNDKSAFSFGVEGWKAFGSWSEYTAIGSNLTSGNARLKVFGSAAAFGQGLAIAQPISGGATSVKGCDFTKLHIKNANPDFTQLCSEPKNTNMGNSAAFRGLADRIALRYANRVSGNQWISGDTANIYDSQGYATSGTWDNNSITPKNSEITYYHHDGPYDIAATNISKGKTVIVEIDGTATIKGNITYADSNSDNNIYESEVMNSIYDIPQVIIFATNVDIDPSVTQIDAWLMVGLDESKTSTTKIGGAANGEINTCANGVTRDTLIASNSGTETSTVGSGNMSLSAPCRNRLKINGPVQAKKLNLFRTWGAGMGLNCKYDYNSAIDYSSASQAQWPNGGRPTTNNCGNNPSGYGSGNFPYDSATPAEVFNLRADAYLWAYRQSENYSQAFVTYQREVAPRF